MSSTLTAGRAACARPRRRVGPLLARRCCPPWSCLVPSPALAAGGPALIGHWTFDEGTGTTAADSSGAGHPLTLQRCHVGPGRGRTHALSVNGARQYAQSAAR